MSRWVSLDGPRLYCLVTCLTQSELEKGRHTRNLLSVSLCCQFSARHLLRPHSSLWKLWMDSCVIPQGLVCCGGVVPNLSPVKGKATCTFVNLSASTSLSILFAQPSPSIPTIFSFLKIFHAEGSPRCSSHKHVVFISVLSAQSYVEHIFVCMCVCVYISVCLKSGKK